MFLFISYVQEVSFQCSKIKYIVDAFPCSDEFEQRNDRKLAHLKNMVERKALAGLGWDGLGTQVSPSI